MVAESNTRKHCIYFLCYLRPPPTGSAQDTGLRGNLSVNLCFPQYSSKTGLPLRILYSIF